MYNIRNNKINFLILLSAFLMFSPLTKTYAGSHQLPSFYSEAVVIIDSTTGKVLFQKNAIKPMYPASITKILTAIITIETQDLTEKASVSDEAVKAIGTRVYLLEGEEMELAQLLHGLMVSSGNDAAIVIAEHIDGSVEAFAERMNRFAENEIGVSNSNFSNPHGLFEDNHITTALDMARISAYAMKNEAFRELVGTHSVEWVGKGWETILYNHHPLLRSEADVIGIKNGFVSRSGYTLSSAVKRENTEFIIVTLKSPSKSHAQRDALAASNYAFNNFETQFIKLEKDPFLKNYLYQDLIPVSSKKAEKINYEVARNGDITFYGETGNELNRIESKEQHLVKLKRFKQNKLMYSVGHIAEESKVSIIDWLIITGFPRLIKD